MATKKATPKKDLSNIELVPDAWPRFEKFIREIVKAGPQHRTGGTAVKSGPNHKLKTKAKQSQGVLSGVGKSKRVSK